MLNICNHILLEIQQKQESFTLLFTLSRQQSHKTNTKQTKINERLFVSNKTYFLCETQLKTRKLKMSEMSNEKSSFPAFDFLYVHSSPLISKLSTGHNYDLPLLDGIYLSIEFFEAILRNPENFALFF